MNDGITVCINVLRSIFQHLQHVKGVPLTDISNDELIEVIKPYAKIVGKYFSCLSTDQMSQFRALRGIQGQTTGTRRVEEAIRNTDDTFKPVGLDEFLAREKAQTTTRSFEIIQRIEKILQATILSELKNEYSDEEQSWWFNGVPKAVRKKVDDRINDEAGKKGGREENFDLIDYRDIVIDNWSLFESTLGKGNKGSKDSKTKWIVEVNDLRKSVMHASKGVSLPITEEQLSLLEGIHTWLQSQCDAQVGE